VTQRESSSTERRGLLRSVNCKSDEGLPEVLAALDDDGCVVVHNVLSSHLIADIRAALWIAKDAVEREISIDRLRAAGEFGVVRTPMRYDPRMFELLAVEPVLQVVDATVSATAILHTQNGFVLPATDEANTSSFQSSFHMDFPRVLNGYLASVNTLVAIDEFREDNGATRVVLGSHQSSAQPDVSELHARSVAATCPAGSMVVFDSTLWHAAGPNASANRGWR